MAPIVKPVSQVRIIDKLLRHSRIISKAREEVVDSVVSLLA